MRKRSKYPYLNKIGLFTSWKGLTRVPPNAPLEPHDAGLNAPQMVPIATPIISGPLKFRDSRGRTSVHGPTSYIEHSHLNIEVYLKWFSIILKAK